MKKPLISIIGSTATGKTKLALFLAEKFSKDFAFIDIISADSRQVYKGMEIGTGVDVPPEFQRLNSESFFEKGNVRLHGVSFLRPNEEWSVMHFQRFARDVMENSWAQNGLPILVGELVCTIGIFLTTTHSWAFNQMKNFAKK